MSHNIIPDPGATYAPTPLSVNDSLNILADRIEERLAGCKITGGSVDYLTGELVFNVAAPSALWLESSRSLAALAVTRGRTVFEVQRTGFTEYTIRVHSRRFCESPTAGFIAHMAERDLREVTR